MTSRRTSDLLDLSAKRFLITGANSGLGLATALALARAGAQITLGCRDPQRGQAALAQVRAAGPEVATDLVPLDLANLKSVKECAAQVSDGPALSGLINNAGVMAPPRRTLTADGFEQQWGTNHLGHFALTGWLLPFLARSDSARVVTVTSMAHRFGRLNYAGLKPGPDSPRYRAWPEYARSKLANLIFSLELQRRHGDKICSVAAHPGWSNTELMANGPGQKKGVGLKLMEKTADLFGQSATAGAAPIIFAAGMPEVRGAEFFGPDGIAEIRGNPTRVTPSAAAVNRDSAARLWAISENHCGFNY